MPPRLPRRLRGAPYYNLLAAVRQFLTSQPQRDEHRRWLEALARRQPLDAASLAKHDELLRAVPKAFGRLSAYERRLFGVRRGGLRPDRKHR